MGTKIKRWMFPAALAAVISAAAVAQAQDTASVQFVVNTTATVKVSKGTVEVQQSVTGGATGATLKIPLGSSTGVLNGARIQQNAPAMVSSRNGSVLFRLSAQSYQNAEIALYTVKGKQVMRGKASAAEASKSIAASGYLTAGVYLLSVRGAEGNAFASRIAHRGGALDVKVAFLSETGSTPRSLAKEAAEGDWDVKVSATGYVDSVYKLALVSGTGNAKQNITLKAIPNTTNPKDDFTETVGSVTFQMIYVPGGTFTIGCEKSSGCPADAKAVSGVKLSNYYISKTEVTNALWKAVMGSVAPPPTYAQNTGSATHMDWFQAIEFTCKLSQLTGRKYHMTTEAEWEYAAKNQLSKLSNIGSGEEWAYNTWSSTHSGGTDPIGPKPDIGLDGKPILTTQKTRRDAQGTADNITGRLIRSIDGIGPALRLAISDEMDYPPDMVPACDVHAPVLGEEPVNSYRDPRWVTGDGAKWGNGAGTTVGTLNLKVWADGTAQYGSTNGQWFTSNNITFVFVPTSGSIKRFAYIFLSETEGALIPNEDFDYMTGAGYIGKIAKVAATNTKPTVSNLKSGEELAKAQSNFESDYKMVDMTNIPTSAQKQDSRIMDEDTPNAAKKGWFQDNSQAGGVHHYRKDVDPDEFRFTVNNPGNTGAYSRVFLANGTWFTVNNTFLRVTKDGYVAEYLYTVTPNGTFYHNSFMAYERADFRMFKKETNASWPNTTCGSYCAQEIPKGEGKSLYAQQGDKGKSTFVPAPCPSGGCK